MDLKKLAYHKSSIKPPSLINSPFKGKKVIKPPLPFKPLLPIHNRRMIVGLLMSWKFGNDFDLRFHDLPLHVPGLFHLAFKFFMEKWFQNLRLIK